jgi:hypothetical protein
VAPSKLCMSCKVSSLFKEKDRDSMVRGCSCGMARGRRGGCYGRASAAADCSRAGPLSLAAHRHCVLRTGPVTRLSGPSQPLSAHPGVLTLADANAPAEHALPAPSSRSRRFHQLPTASLFLAPLTSTPIFIFSVVS